MLRKTTPNSTYTLIKRMNSFAWIQFLNEIETYAARQLWTTHSQQNRIFFSKKKNICIERQSIRDWMFFINSTVFHPAIQLSTASTLSIFSLLCVVRKIQMLVCMSVRCLAHHCRNLSEYSNSGKVNEMEAVECSCFWFCLSFLMWVNFPVFFVWVNMFRINHNPYTMYHLIVVLNDAHHVFFIPSDELASKRQTMHFAYCY